MRAVLLFSLIGAVTAAAAALPAAAAPTPPPSPTPALVRLARLEGQAFDIAFVREIIPIHEEAVEIAYAATLNADHTELLRWNQQMIDRKTNQVKQMLGFLKEAGATPGRRNVGIVTEPVKKMRGLKGAALERAYMPLIITHLEGSMALANLATTKAAQPEVRALALVVARVEKQEIALLRGWLKQWYGM